jgi:hypothetical protein
MSSESVFYAIVRKEKEEKPLENADDIMSHIQKQIKR